MTALDWTELGKEIKGTRIHNKLHLDSSHTKDISKYLIAGIIVTLGCVVICLRSERKKHLKELNDIEKSHRKEIELLKSKL